MIKYIGKTIKPLEYRLRQHIRERHRRVTPKNSWVSSLLSRGEMPVIWSLELCDESNWERRERYWIWMFRPMGLKNVSDGGDTGPDRTGYRFTDEQRAKLREIAKTKARPNLTAEQRKICGMRLRDARRLLTPEVLKRRAETSRRRGAWRKGVEAAAAANRGKKYSPERVARARAARMAAFAKRAQATE